MKTARVIGAGPAGLMAAEVLAQAGLSVRIADAMPSVGRKFLMAGKSGLNLTKDEPEQTFIDRFGPLPTPMGEALATFGPAQVKDWAKGLGQEIFIGTTGRVFPKAMKASPLLRAWMQRLGDLGVSVDTRWRWTGWSDDGLRFETPDGAIEDLPDVTILALGGASWRRLGSDGAWSAWLDDTAPFQPSNMGLKVKWSEHMAPHIGKPVKGICLTADGVSSRGEFILSSTGIEGGGIYDVSAMVRDGAPLTLDLCPDLTNAQVADALAKPYGKSSLSNRLRKSLRLGPTKIALLHEWGRPLPAQLAPVIKSLPVCHDGPRPLDQAISTAGGLRFEAMNNELMLTARPGIFAAGEMLDWEAPTGGYLITGCLATGRWAAQGALRWLGH